MDGQRRASGAQQTPPCGSLRTRAEEGPWLAWDGCHRDWTDRTRKGGTEVNGCGCERKCGSGSGSGNEGALYLRTLLALVGGMSALDTCNLRYEYGTGGVSLNVVITSAVLGIGINTSLLLPGH